MTTFTDGPAKGHTLELQRAPVFLRVVTKDGKVDALDQRDDAPRPGESLWAYVLTRMPSAAFIRRTGGGGRVMIAEYRLCAAQPSHETLADAENWAAWCEAMIPQVPPDLLRRLLS